MAPRAKNTTKVESEDTQVAVATNEPKKRSKVEILTHKEAKKKLKDVFDVLKLSIKGIDTLPPSESYTRGV